MELDLDPPLGVMPSTNQL